jgi:hypothetical protein
MNIVIRLHMNVGEDVIFSKIFNNSRRRRRR